MNIMTFVNEVRVEISKMTWAKRDEFWGSVIVVCILIAFFGLVLGFFDFFFAGLIKELMR